MQRLWIKLTIRIIATLVLLVCTHFANAGTDSAQVIRVIDGDTIEVIYQGAVEKVRLLCVDTPESVHPNKSKNTPAGKIAAAYTKARLFGKVVNLEFENTNRGLYGRLLAYVIIDGKNFNVELVEKGYSPYYTKYGKSEKFDDQFSAAEWYAKHLKKGT